MAKAFKQASGNWRVNQYIGKDENGKQKFKSFTARTKKEAEYLAAEYVLFHKNLAKNKVLGKLVDDYIDARVNVLSPTTIQGYRKIRSIHFQDLMEMPIDKIDNLTLQNSINKESMKYAPKTVCNAYGLISSVLALNSYYKYHVSLPRKQKKYKVLPPPQEIMRIVKGTDIELPVLLAMWLSFRMSELKGLKKSDIHNRVITVNRAMVYVNGEYIEKHSTKTPSSRRKLVIPDYIYSLVEQLPEEQEYLVTLSGAQIYQRFTHLLEINNIPHITFHDLRSINASVMLMLGIPDKYAMERGGWETDCILKSVYQQTFSAERQEVDRKIDAYFESLREA